MCVHLFTHLSTASRPLSIRYLFLCSFGMASRFILRVRSSLRLPVLTSTYHVIKLACDCIWNDCVPQGPHFYSYSSRLGSNKGFDGLVAPSLVRRWLPALACLNLQPVCSSWNFNEAAVHLQVLCCFVEAHAVARIVVSRDP